MIQTIGRYQILEELGKGAMATVYKAFDPDIDRTLAIKMLRAERCADTEYRSRFLREARTAGTLSHKNIVTVYDVQEQDDRPFIAMELLEGHDLEKIIKAKTRLVLDSILSVGIQLAEALGYAHERGIVHRDIKPSNIVLLHEGHHLKITDFGIAHVKDASEQTKAGAILGTPYYMAPEQMQAQKIDGRADLFSVGVILYELLTGKKPFKGDCLMDVLDSIKARQLQPLEELAPDTPVGLVRIIDKLLDRDPRRRFRTGQELARALDEVVSHLHRVDGPERLSSARFKWPLLAGAATALVLLLGSAIIHHSHVDSATSLLLGQGVTLAKMVAAENAEAVLKDDWPFAQTWVERLREEKSFAYATITDHRDVIRAGTNGELMGKPYERPSQASLLPSQEGVEVFEVTTPDGAPVFQFDAPILFQDTEVGRLHFALTQASLQEATRLAWFMLLALTLLTASAAAAATYLINARLARATKISVDALQALERGHYEKRLRYRQEDTFGPLFGAINRLAESLQRARDNVKNESPPATPKASEPFSSEVEKSE